MENRENKRPQLADLRESGTIEQDADVVMFLYREEYYLAREEPKNADGHEAMVKWQDEMEKVHNLAEVIVAKQRHGPVGTVRAHYEAQFTHFSDHIGAGHLPDGAFK